MIYLLPFIAAVIGWFTNYVAVKMLFRPQKPVKILFLTIQGVFPKRQKVVAEKIGRMVADELLSVHDIKDRFNHPDNIEHIKNSIEEKIDEYLYKTFPANYPLTALFLSDKRKDRIKDDLVVEVEKMAPDVVNRYIENIEASLNIEHMVAEKIENLSPAKLENLIMNILKKEFSFIEWVGAIIGFLIGIMQVVMVLLT